MNHAMSALSVTAVCLLYAISLTGCPPLTSAYTLQHDFEQDQIEFMLSQFLKSPTLSDNHHWLELEELKQRWENDRSQSKRKANIRRKPNGCNPITGRCSAGWKRSPNRPSSASDPLGDASAGFEAWNIDLPKIVSSPYLTKRAPSRPQSTGRRRTKSGQHPRALRRPKCNQFNGRCSAGWKRSPIPFDNHQSYEDLTDSRNRIEENVFDILDRLQDDYQESSPNMSI